MCAAPVSVYVCNLPLSVTDADLDKWIRRETQGKVTPLSVFIVYERNETDAARGGRGRGGAAAAVSRSVSAPRARGIAFVSVLPSQAAACLALNGCEMGGRVLGLRVAIPRGTGDKFAGNGDARSTNSNTSTGSGSSGSSASSTSYSRGGAVAARGKPAPEASRQPQYKPVDAKSRQPTEQTQEQAAPAAAPAPSLASAAPTAASPSSSSSSPSSFAAVASASLTSAASSSPSPSSSSPSSSPSSAPSASPIIAAASSSSAFSPPAAPPALSEASTWPQLTSAKPVWPNPSTPPAFAAAPAQTITASFSASAPSSASSPAPLVSAPPPELRELLQCPICCEAYDAVSRIPQLVHSNHTVCSACIDGVSEYGRRDPYPCPMCRTPVTLAERVNNTLVCDMVELITRQHQQQRQPIMRPRPPDIAAPLHIAAFTAASTPVPSARLPLQDALDIEESKERDIILQHPAWQPQPTVSPAPVDSNALAELETLCSAASGLSLRQTDDELLSKAEAQRVNAAAAAFLASSFCLANRRLFPAIDALPHADDPVVFTQHEGHLAMQHHTFMCELLCRSSSPLVLGVRDRDGKLIVVDFRQRDGHDEHRVDVAQLRLGHTVFVRYATVSAFADGQWGVKAEHPQLCKVVPLSIAEVDRLDGQRARKAFFDRVYGSSCALCDGRPAVTLCPRCRVVDYCSRECQHQDWPEHRSRCRLWQLMAEVYELPLEAVTPQPFVNSLAVPI